MNSISASQLVATNPGVISAGGNALQASGLFLTTNTRVPNAQVLSFPLQSAVASYFGGSSDEALAATAYFAGFDNSNIKPAAMLFSFYPAIASSAWLESGSLAAMTLTQLQALSGTLIVTVDGVQKTSATITLSGAASFSAAATLIQAGFTTPGFTVTFDSVSSAFLFTDTSTGATSILSFATGTLSASLLLTAATGAVVSTGAAAATPTAAMAAIVNTTTNWVSFTTIFNPDVSGNANKLLFAAWANTTKDYIYVMWDTDATAATSNAATTSAGNILAAAASNGTVPLWTGTYLKAATMCGIFASVDFTQTNGRITVAFKSQSGLTPDVTDGTTATNLLANSYNYYGAYATAAQNFNMFNNGSITGQFKWADSYLNQIWLNNALQLALMTLLTSVKSLPYNSLGYTLIRAACMDPINQALNFGAISGGVALSALQIAEVNAAAGMPIDQQLSTQGYYLQILPAIAQVRGARTSPPMSLWYVDAGSIQKISLASVEIQ